MTRNAGDSRDDVNAADTAPSVIPPPHSEPPELIGRAEADPSAGLWRNLKATLLFDRQLWLVRMRWIAIACIGVTVGVAGWAGWVRDTTPLILITISMAGYNAAFLGFWKAQKKKDPARFDENSVFPPILCDLASLTMLLHWSGGIENPFALFFVFHTAIGATFLSPRRAYALGATTSILWSSTVSLEYAGILQHHSLFLHSGEHQLLNVSSQSGTAFAGYMIAFILMLFGVIYFVQTVERGRLEAEARAFHRERVALARKRMARIGEISAGIAHTVRNPLQGVINCLDLLRAESPPGDDSSQELFDMMDEGLQRVERVTRRLLVLTRERRLRMVSTDVTRLIYDSLRFLRQEADEKGISLEMDCADLPDVLLDPEAVSESLVNIIDNAIHVCSEGDRIQIETKRLSDPAPSIGIFVRDSGPGIPDAMQSKVFDPFFTTKAVGEGTGLGLAITREVIEGHQGSISVTSDPSGSSFNVILPLRQ